MKTFCILLAGLQLSTLVTAEEEKEMPQEYRNFENFCSKFLSIIPFATTVTTTLGDFGTSTVFADGGTTTVTITVATQTEFITEMPTITEFFTETFVDVTTTTTSIVPERLQANLLVARAEVENSREKESNEPTNDERLSSACSAVVHFKTNRRGVLLPPTETVFVTKTSTTSVTALVTNSVTLFTTESTTTTTTTTSIVSVGPCDDIQPLGWGTLRMPDNVTSESVTANTFHACCEACAASSGCVFYTWSPDSSSCTINSQNGAASDDMCPNGIQDVDYSDGPPAFQIGPCGRAVPDS
ncbi:hypothetical protein ACJ41O_011928 [Fusarium nematophilum]